MPFNGINNLRDANESVQMEPWMLKELARCARDPIYFIKNYVYINTKDKGMQLFKLYDFQEELIIRFNKHRFNIVKFPRQCGKSATTRAFILWYALFNEDKVVAILANKLNLAQEQLQQLRDSYINLPYWMQPGVKQWNKRGVQFSHGTRIVCAATSPDGIRGMSINLLYLDEFAFVKSHIADEFIASVFPTISSGKTTKVVITSTPSGMNHFFRMWEDACTEDQVDIIDSDETNGYVRSEIPWNAKGLNRDAAWARDEMKKIGEIRFNQEYMCEFIGSVSTLIDHHFLKTLESKKPMKIPNLPEYIRIYEPPLKKEKLEAEGWEYAASLDSGYGVHQDSSVLQIFLIKSNITVHQVAVISSNKMDIDLFCKKCYVILKKYHDPALIIEQNGPGIAAMSFFYNTVEYENLLHFDPSGRHMGLWASEKTKQNACILFKSYIERRFMTINDRATINEMHSFGKVTQEHWGGLGGNHDDHITAAYWIPFYLQSAYYYGKVVEVNMKAMEEDEIILKTEEELAEERIALEKVRNSGVLMKEMENNAKYLSNNKHKKNKDDDDAEAGMVMFQR